MTPEKKILSPVLYPADQDLKKRWFIKYQVEDFVNGGFKYKKYEGLLNRYNTVADRKQLAAEYINLMHRGEPLPNYQGMRSAPHSIKPKQSTDIVACCDRFLLQCSKLHAAGKLSKATLQQYRSKLNNFYKWLAKTDRYSRAIGAMDKYEAQDFLLYLATEKKICAYTVNYYKSLLGRIWADYKTQLKDVNPWREIAADKHDVQHLASYPVGLQNHISACLPEFNPQLWMFFQCIYYCAIRPHQELRRLKIKHIDFQKGLFFVPKYIAKDKDDRYVVIYNKLMQQMKDAGFYKYDPDDYIFSYHGKPGPTIVGKNYFQRKWQEYRQHFGINSAYKLYAAKHTAGKKLSKATNPYITQQHFGHSTASMTENYTSGLPVNELLFLADTFPELGYQK